MAPNPYEEKPDELSVLMRSFRRTANGLQITGILCIGIAIIISLAVMIGVLK